MPTKLFMISNNNNYNGSLKLKPYVIFGRVISLAYYAVDVYTIADNYFLNTLSIIPLHI